MTPTKHRALIALADATDRPFLSAAPLMAIVEAVAVLDEAGLLVNPKQSALEAVLLNAITSALAHDNERDLRESLQRVLDLSSLTPAVLKIMDAASEAEEADDELARRGFEGAPESGFGDGITYVRGLRLRIQLLAGRLASAEECLTCPACGHDVDGHCTNFPACRESTAPF